MAQIRPGAPQGQLPAGMAPMAGQVVAGQMRAVAPQAVSVAGTPAVGTPVVAGSMPTGVSSPAQRFISQTVPTTPTIPAGQLLRSTESFKVSSCLSKH